MSSHVLEGGENLDLFEFDLGFNWAFAAGNAVATRVQSGMTMQQRAQTRIPVV